MPRYADMFVDLAEDPRADPPGSGDERATLLGFLALRERIDGRIGR